MKQPGPYGTDAAGNAPPFTDEGATQKLDNERVTVWDFTAKPLGRTHRHTHDAVVVAIDGRSPRATWVKQGTVHQDEAAGEASRDRVPVALRTDLRLTQSALAARIGAANKAIVYQWESRRRRPSPVLWQRVQALRSL